MARNLYSLYEQYCLKFLDKAMHGLVGLATNVVVDEKSFQQAFIDPTWKALSLPIRMIGRDKVRWDEFCLALRKEVFVNLKGLIGLRDTGPRVTALMDKMFGAAAAKAPLPRKTAAQMPSSASLAAVPVAKPVQAAPPATPPRP